MNYAELKAEFYEKRNGQKKPTIDSLSMKNRRMDALKKELEALKEKKKVRSEKSFN